jgi:hypothetical protein
VKSIFFHKHVLLIGTLILLFGALQPSPSPARTLTAPPPESTGHQTFPDPDSDVVNLKISKHYFLNPDSSYRLRLYVKRRILTYKGKKDYADFKFTYNSSHQSAKLVRANTLTADGRKIKVSKQEVHDIPAPWNSEVSLYSQARQMVVNLPAVEPGSEIELEIELQDRIGFWCNEYFRLNEPIREKEVIFTVPPKLDLKWKKPGMIKLEEKIDRNQTGNTIYIWRATKVPALFPEKWAPDPVAEGFCLQVSSFTSQARVAAFYNGFFRAALPARKVTGEILTENQSDEDKAKALCHRIFHKLRKASTPYIISFQETAFKLQAPEVTARKGYGTDADLALLFFDRLRRQGLNPRILMTGDKGKFLSGYADFPSPGWWKTTLVEYRGEFFYFGQEKPAPGITGFDGCRALDLDSGRLLTIQDRKPARILSETRYQVSSDFSIKGKFRLTLEGDIASGWRLEWRDLSPGERKVATSQLLHELNPTAHGNGPLEISNLRDDCNPLILSGTFSIRNPFATLDTEEEVIFPLNAPNFTRPYPTLLTTRSRPLAIPDNLINNHRVIIKLPENLRPTLLPEPGRGILTRLNWTVATSYDPRTRTLTYTRELIQKRGLLDSSDPEYRSFLETIRSLYRADNLGIGFTKENPGLPTTDEK